MGCHVGKVDASRFAVIVNQSPLSIVLPSVTPTPSPSTAAASGGDVNWTDIVSALSDAVVAIGTLGTLLLIVVTVRQQGRALGLQIQQLEHERMAREVERERGEQEARQQKGVQVRRVRISSHELEYDSASPYSAAFSNVGSLLIEEMQSSAARIVWRAAYIEVRNQSDMVVRNLSIYAEGLEGPDYLRAPGATELKKTYELDHLGPGRQAAFVWMNRVEKALHSAKAELHFSDEDGHRWATDLEGNTVRLDQAE
jgi:hypothetical protein